MPSWVIFTALRHFRTKRREKGDTSTLLSIIGILSGVMTMITVIGVMNGFQGDKIDNLIEIGSSHIVLEPVNRNVLDTDIIEHEFIESIYPASESLTAMSSEFSNSLTGVQVYSFPRDIRAIDTAFRQKVPIMPGGRFDIMETNNIVIGYKLANVLNVVVGDKVSLLGLKSQGSASFNPSQVDFKITGIFKSGYLPIDSSLVFISNESAKENLTDNFVYKIKLWDLDRLPNVLFYLKDNPVIKDFFEIKSWKNFNTSYYSALKNEKNLMTVLIGLIFLVVGVNIFNSHRRAVYLRYEEISVLKTLGATSLNIRVIYILEGLLIGFLGATFGVLTGLFITYNINNVFKVLEWIINFFLNLVNESNVSLYGGQFFYINEVPVRVYFSECLWVYISALVTSVVAAHMASKRVSVIKPGEVIRNE